MLAKERIAWYKRSRLRAAQTVAANAVVNGLVITLVVQNQGEMAEWLKALAC